MKDTSTQRSFLRWAGSKRQLISTLAEYWKESYTCYYEPFMGSAQLFFSLSAQIRRAVISDKNEELVEMYKQIKLQPYSVHQILKQKENSSRQYYIERSADPKKLGINQRAARFIYLNWLCFNGLYRTNNSGQFNVPYSNTTGKSLDNWEMINRASHSLKNASILSGDFESIVEKRVGKNEFVYLDPPYALENKRIFSQYGNTNFGTNDIERLKSLLHLINQRGAYFLLSYAYEIETKQIFKEWTTTQVEVQRNIAGFSKYRKKAPELLVTNIR